MSVINTMLKDLEQRQGQTLSGRYLPPTPRRRGLPLLVGLLLLVVLPAVAYGVWHGWLRPAEPLAATPVPKAESTPAVSTPSAASATLEKPTSQPVVEAQTPSAQVQSAQVQSAAVVSVATPETTPAAAPAQPASSVKPTEVSPTVVAPAPRREPAQTQASDAETLPVADQGESAELEDALLGPDEGPQVTEASAPETDVVEEPMGSQEIAE